MMHPPVGDVPRQILLDLADQFGIRADVAAVLAEKEAAGQFGLRKMTLGTLLRQARQARRMIGSEAARASGRARSVVNAAESDVSKNLRIDTAIALSRGYHLPLVLIFCTALRTYGMLPEPGVHPVPRNRERKPAPPG